MWIDQLEVGKLQVRREIESPASPDTLILNFPDGSVLSIRAYAGEKLNDFTGEADATDYADTTTAMNVYGGIVRFIYDLDAYSQIIRGCYRL